MLRHDIVGVFLVAAGWCMIPAVHAAESPATPVYLRCEYRVDPLGIDVVEPRLSWEMQDARRGAKQTAYQVLVAGSPEKLSAGQGDLWDSGRVATDQSTQVVYAGKPLSSRMRCYWKVRIWDADGNPTSYSQPALWTMGLLKPEDIKAKWIGVNGSMLHPDRAQKNPLLTFDGCVWVWTAEPGIQPQESAPAGARYFRRSIAIPEGRNIRQASFLLVADDAAELYVNGKEAKKGILLSAPTVIDIKEFLVPGKENTFAVAAMNSAASPAGVAGKIEIQFDSGDPLVFTVDGSWKWAVAETPGWNQPDFDDSQWSSVVELCKFGQGPWAHIKLATISDPLACPLFRKEFKLNGEVRRATVYGSALGVYRLYLNGKPIGDDYFTPDWTDYKKRVYYNTYDVTDLVRSNGPNAIGGILGSGWYTGGIGWQLMRNHYGEHPRLFAQLEVELADGTIQTIATDGSWTTAFGPYIEGEFLAGETYDATKEIPGWASPGTTAGNWQPVAVTDSIAPAMIQAFPSVTVQETGVLRPIKITEPKPGVFVYDLGQNFAGFARLKVRGPAGTKVVLRFAEVLNPDGTIYTWNLRAARTIDTYVLRGDGEEVWQPRFTFHGFRYVEVTGYPGKPGEDAITGIAINSKIPLVGEFECSSPMVNQLYQNIVWTQRANHISVPTDCPQRDERLGWTGDAETFVRAATYNADMAAFYSKWLVDLEDAQKPDGEFPDVAPRVVDLAGGVAAWGDAGTICPWTIYDVYNDRRLLAKHYDAMVRWVEYCRRNSDNLLRPAAGFGDWLSIQADTPLDVIATAYFAYSTHLTADAARVLGKTDDAKKYDALFDQIKAAFNKAYVADDGRIKGNTQTCYVMALWFELLPPEKRAKAVQYLVDDIRSRNTHLSTGFVGTSVLMPTLSAFGQTPIAYQLLLNDTFPSWGFSIKHGATSIWERWDGWTPEKGFQDPGMNSFAHYSFGAVARWMFQTVAGIDMAKPGFQQLRIRPQPAEGLTWVKAAYGSIHGRIATEWRIEGGKLVIDVTVPANTSATVYLPVAKPADATEGGKPIAQAKEIKFLRSEGNESLFEVGAGQYRFAMPWKQ